MNKYYIVSYTENRTTTVVQADRIVLNENNFIEFWIDDPKRLVGVVDVEEVFVKENIDE